MRKEKDIVWHEKGWLDEDLKGDAADLYSPDYDLLSPEEQAVSNAMSLNMGITMAIEEGYISPVEAIADICKAKQKLALQEGELTPEQIENALFYIIDVEEMVLKEMAKQKKRRNIVKYRNHMLAARIAKKMRYRGFNVGVAASNEKRPRRK